MKSIGKWMLGAAVAAATLGLGTTSAHAAQWGVYVGTQSAYVPPCPGPGYSWVAGYYDGGYWVPGRWNYVGVGYGYYGGGYRVEHRDWDHDRRDWDRDRRGWDNDRRGHDRDDFRGRDGDHFRGDRGRDHDRR